MTFLNQNATKSDEGNDSPDQLERQALEMWEWAYDGVHSSLDDLDCNQLLRLAITLRQDSMLRVARYVALKAVTVLEGQNSGNLWNALKELALIERLLKMFPEAEEHCRKAIRLVEESDRGICARLESLRNCLLDCLEGQGRLEEAQQLKVEWLR